MDASHQLTQPSERTGIWDRVEANADRIAWLFVGLGILFRWVRYLVDQPLWGDEAFVAVNLIDRGFLGLLRPLDYHQVCPPLFLWAEAVVVRLLDFNERSLRLFPILCGTATMVLFPLLARRLMRGIPYLLAVATFAVAFYPIRHAAEVKPYSTDLLVALVLLIPAVDWLLATDRASRWILLALLMPIALGLSHPAVFVGGGIAAACLVPVVRERRPAVMLAYAVFGLSLLASFTGLFLLVTHGQAEGAGQGMWRYWAAGFPLGRSPLGVVFWFIEVHVGHAFSYPIGGGAGSSLLTSICFAAGIVALLRRGEKRLTALLVAPFALGFVAACLGRYPYGGSARTMQYVAPAVCILAGIGAADLLSRARTQSRRDRRIALVLSALVIIGVVPTVRTIVQPYKMKEDQVARDFARSFWPRVERNAVTVCAHTDLGATFEPRHWQLDRTAVYLCNRRIYSPRVARAGRADLAAVSDVRPLRCVLYNEEPVGTPAFDAWYTDMTRRYDLRGVKRYEPVPKQVIHGKEFEDRYVVYEFAPRTDVARTGPRPLR